MKSIARTIVISAIFIAPVLASAQTVVGGLSSNGSGFLGFSWGNGGGGGWGGCAGSICEVAGTILYIINGVLIPVLFAVAFIVFLYGIASAYIFSNGDPEEIKKGHKLVFWGVVAFAIMISIWGLVNVVVGTFGLAGYYAPPPPTSY
ncbi:hypothetical protein A3G63_03135 [Candidatus Kaiserbacteria bacterium RIFCSPLOWO2_12_FULL_52_8]|uniref:DUF4190 domain-containing protein n=1 Tax=Candidatus Kaiserbacteria bacterium RIFCSPHIGHO2_01_FULL_53_31 TaxID=1798481 RepID=A0A1F6CH19_9BACT|nr:MAG: hypothetical protein A2678_03405 [Candidatus Kaiserbacteria bacterium RIFCSPHIGHO2_01_FULL_53_31]OGG92701.1 MAG: hypothetical protein A3G63_03135 [Candidatus Kaiserbacteria bacterium RIFCSPLOWO2_12_FULL_52_8]